MKLRWRVSLAFFVATVAILGTSSIATYSMFEDTQVRELDRQLVARVLHEAEYIEHSEGVMTIVQGTYLRIGALDHHVKFAALFDREGTLIARSATFDQVPPRSELGGSDGVPFDFDYGERSLRGILWPLDEGELLLAASRGALDEDIRKLQGLLSILFIAGAATSLLLAGVLSRLLTRNIEHLAGVARRIAGGELQLRVTPGIGGAAIEVRALAHDLDGMVDSLQSALAAEQRFVSNAAHELRSPLTALSGELELALRREREPEAYKRALRDALDNAHGLQHLAEDLLDLARTRMRGAVPAESSAIDEVLALALRALGTRAEAKIEIHVPQARVRGRREDLARLFRNLLENAIEHAPEDSRVRVEGVLSDGMLSVGVEDDGPGVDEHLVSRMFEPFVRGGEERARSGAGLGLAIARELASSVGGGVRLDRSRQPTRFVAWLPVTS